MRSGLKNAGIMGSYSGHSFRRGAATTAKEAGLSESEIQLLGRWKSDSYGVQIVYTISPIAHTQRLPPLPNQTTEKHRKRAIPVWAWGVVTAICPLPSRPIWPTEGRQRGGASEGGQIAMI